MTETGPEMLRADAGGLARAAELLQAGALVAFPTETVYGLGADAGDDRAVARIYAAKGRPAFNPLIAHVADLDAARALVEFTPAALALADGFWPGSLTLVLPLRGDAAISKLVTAGLPTLAVRVPGSALARDLLARVGRPVAAPSANPSGRISPTNAAHVASGLGAVVAAILDGGPAGVGLESTIVDCTGIPRLLRPGGVPLEGLRGLIPGLIASDITDNNSPSAPGQLSHHYAPDAALRMDATDRRLGEVLLGFGDTKNADLNLSETGDLTEAAANLFAHLHALDARRAPIAVAPVPDVGLGRAINDRLRRAAAPRGGAARLPQK